MDMLAPLLVMIVGFMVFFVWLLFSRLQGEILVRERKAKWARELAGRGGV